VKDVGAEPQVTPEIRIRPRDQDRDQRRCQQDTLKDGEARDGGP
jgi:hypothetical protein